MRNISIADFEMRIADSMTAQSRVDPPGRPVEVGDCRGARSAPVRL